MLLDVIAPETESARQAADPGTPATPQEYPPLTILADRHGQEWTVTSHGDRAYVVGVMPPFEAMQIDRIEALHGPTVVKAASPNHRFLRHPRPFPGCHNCPPAPCRCGNEGCTDYDVHYTEWASTETAWRRAA